MDIIIPAVECNSLVACPNNCQVAPDSTCGYYMNCEDYTDP